MNSLARANTCPMRTSMTLSVLSDAREPGALAASGDGMAFNSATNCFAVNSCLPGFIVAIILYFAQDNQTPHRRMKRSTQSVGCMVETITLPVISFLQISDNNLLHFEHGVDHSFRLDWVRIAHQLA